MEKHTGPVADIIMKNGGKMTIALYPDKAPISVASFVELAQTGFYDGLNFHRVIEGFVIQGGAKSGTCAGEDIGFTIKGEFKGNGVDTGLNHGRGAISMARSGHPDSGSSQFFVVHQDAAMLDGQYAAFGMMTDGFDVLDAIATTPTRSAQEENRPIEPQIIETIAITLGDYQPPAQPERIGQRKI